MGRRARWIGRGVVCVVAACLAGEATAATLQSWVATARIKSGSTTLTDTPSPPAPMPTDSTGFLEANGINIFPPSPPIDAGAGAAYGLPNGTMGVTAGFDALSNFPDLRVFDPFGGASTTYIDELTVVSGSLPAATPVTVRIVFDLAFSNFAQSTLDLALASAHIQSVANGMTLLDANDNRYFLDLDSGLFIQNGLFTGAQHAEFDIATTVGATFSFSAALNAASYGTVYVTGAPGFETDNTASGWSSVAVSFGAEVLGANASVESALLSGPFPDAAGVSPTVAEAAIPFNVFVPEPGLALGQGVVVGLLGVMRAGRRSARGRGTRPPGRRPRR